MGIMIVTTAMHLVVISCRKYVGKQEQPNRREFCI